MNPEEEQTDAFERELARFHRETPPAIWREELIANASPISRRVFGFSRVEKRLAAGIAAVWAVIATLWISQPVDETDYAGLKRLNFPSLTEMAESRPMLAWRSGGVPNLDELP